MIGFLDVDYVYGVTAGDTQYMTDGSLPFDEVKIIGAEENDVIKTYSKKNIFITDVAISEYTVELKRAVMSDGEYEDADGDSIVNELGEDLRDEIIIGRYEDEKQKTKVILVDPSVEMIDIKHLNASEEILEKIPVSGIENETEDYYYIYSGSTCKKKTANISDAIRYASETSGIVVKNTYNIWNRGKKNYYGPIDSETIEKTLRVPASYEISGVDLSDALGFVSRGAILIAHVADEDIVVAGYDASNLYIYDSEDKTTEKNPLKEMQNIFGKAGNRFSVVYIVK